MELHSSTRKKEGTKKSISITTPSVLAGPPFVLIPVRVELLGNCAYPNTG
jgi:hypothetical protein